VECDAVLFDLEPGVIDAVRASPLGELFRPGNLVSQNKGAKTLAMEPFPPLTPLRSSVQART
jgi:hypothetical protein